MHLTVINNYGLIPNLCKKYVHPKAILPPMTIKVYHETCLKSGAKVEETIRVASKPNLVLLGENIFIFSSYCKTLMQLNT